MRADILADGDETARRQGQPRHAVAAGQRRDARPELPGTAVRRRPHRVRGHREPPPRATGDHHRDGSGHGRTVRGLQHGGLPRVAAIGRHQYQRARVRQGGLRADRHHRGASRGDPGEGGQDLRRGWPARPGELPAGEPGRRVGRDQPGLAAAAVQRASEDDARRDREQRHTDDGAYQEAAPTAPMRPAAPRLFPAATGTLPGLPPPSPPPPSRPGPFPAWPSRPGPCPFSRPAARSSAPVFPSPPLAARPSSLAGARLVRAHAHHRPRRQDRAAACRRRREHWAHREQRPARPPGPPPRAPPPRARPGSARCAAGRRPPSPTPRGAAIRVPRRAMRSTTAAIRTGWPDRPARCRPLNRAPGRPGAGAVAVSLPHSGTSNRGAYRNVTCLRAFSGADAEVGSGWFSLIVRPDQPGPDASIPPGYPRRAGVRPSAGMTPRSVHDDTARLTPPWAELTFLLTDRPMCWSV